MHTKSNPWHQFSLSILLLAFSLAALPLGLTFGWRGDFAFLICSSLALVLWLTTRRQIFGLALLAYLVAFPAAFIFIVVRVNPRNPYVRLYNEQLEKKAVDAGLVGSTEDRVETVLGPATSIYRGWTAIVMATGEPAPGAEYYTTYNYAPYPSVPAAKFQVHCHGGKVQSIELYDD